MRASVLPLIAFVVAGCGDKPAPSVVISDLTSLVREVTVSPASTSVVVGGTVQLTAVVRTDPDVDRSVSWSSADSTIATVNQNGVVSGRRTGTIRIVATANADRNVKGASDVRVVETPQP